MGTPGKLAAFSIPFIFERCKRVALVLISHLFIKRPGCIDIIATVLKALVGHDSVLTQVGLVNRCVEELAGAGKGQALARQRIYQRSQVQKTALEEGAVTPFAWGKADECRAWRYRLNPHARPKGILAQLKAKRSPVFTASAGCADRDSRPVKYPVISDAQRPQFVDLWIEHGFHKLASGEHH